MSKRIKALPLLRSGARVDIDYRGKRVCGFVGGGIAADEPITRYVVIALRPGSDFNTLDEYFKAGGVARPGSDPASGPSIWAFVYVERERLETAAIEQGRIRLPK